MSGDVYPPRPICEAQSGGMLCDRRWPHLGSHVDIFGPDIPKNTWPLTEREATEARAYFKEINVVVRP